MNPDVPVVQGRTQSASGPAVARLPSGMAFGTRESTPAFHLRVTRLGDHGATVDGMSPAKLDKTHRCACDVDSAGSGCVVNERPSRGAPLRREPHPLASSLRDPGGEHPAREVVGLVRRPRHHRDLGRRDRSFRHPSRSVGAARVLDKIRDLGLTVISVRRIPSNEEQAGERG